MYRGSDALSAFPRWASGYVRWQRVHPATAAWKRRFRRTSESTYHRVEISITRNTCRFHACSCRAIRVTFPATAECFYRRGTRCCNYIVWPVRNYLTTSNEIRTRIDVAAKKCRHLVWTRWNYGTGVHGIRPKTSAFLSRNIQLYGKFTCFILGKITHNTPRRGRRF